MRIIVVADLRDDNKNFDRFISYEEANQFVSNVGCNYLEVNSQTGFNMGTLSDFIVDTFNKPALHLFRL